MLKSFSGILHTGRLLGILCLCALLASPVKATLESATVISSVGTGQAQLFSYRGACFGVSPLHVMQDAGMDFGPVQIKAYGRMAQFESKRQFGLKDDLVLGQVTGLSTTECGKELDLWPTMPKRQAMAVDGLQLNFVSQDGDITARNVSLREIDDNFIYLDLSGNSQGFQQGMSGSLVRLEGQPVGLLLTAEGKTLRIDYIESLIRRPLEQLFAANPVAVTSIAETLNYEVLESSAGTNLAGNSIAFLSRADPGQSYAVARADLPVTLRIKPSQKLGSLKVVHLGQPRLANKNGLIKEVEVQALSGRHWVYVGHATVPLDAGVVSIALNQKAAREYRLLIKSAYGDSSEVWVGKLLIN